MIFKIKNFVAVARWFVWKTLRPAEHQARIEASRALALQEGEDWDVIEEMLREQEAQIKALDAIASRMLEQNGFEF